MHENDALDRGTAELAAREPGASGPSPTGGSGPSGTARLRDRPEVSQPERGSNGALAFMAHELRTPLTAIIGISDLLHDSQLSPDQRDMIEILGRSARALVEIVNGVLDLEKLEAGKLQLERRTFSPDDCVEECVNLLAASAAQKRVDLAFEVDASVPSLIQGDPVRLRQTLINLMGNALKFTETGQVVVRVSAVTPPGAPTELRFTVADSGPGIPDEILHAIFEPYSQAEASTSRRFGGTGLGLPIAKRLVALMGGDLAVESEVGKGSTFYFTLPTEIDASAGARARVPETRLAGRRILVLEDNPVIGELLVATLARWEVRASLVTDLPRAAVAIREHAFDAALIDGELPGIGGGSAALALRSLPGASALPLVLMSTLGADVASPGRGALLRGVEFAAHVTKPVRPGRLRDALVQACRRDPDGGADGRHDAGLPPVTPRPDDARRDASGRDDASAPDIAARAAANVPASRPSRPSEGRLAGIRVLLTEHDPDLRSTLARSLAIVGADVRTAADGAATLGITTAWDAEAILLDVSLPGMDSFELCRRLKAEPATRLVPVIMMTGSDAVDERRRVVEAGADAILRKPFAREELLARVRSAAEMKRSTDRLDATGADLVMLARAVEGRDPDTLGHLERLSDLSARVAERIGMDEGEVAAVRLSGLVHDIGKAALPEALLAKPASLDSQEWELMRTHPVEGERLCAGVAALRASLPAIRHHHERMDGSGYPDGLAGGTIPVAARVLQVVDVYDALTTARPYRRAESPEGALDILAREVDRGWWDARIVAAFRELVRADLQGRRAFGTPRH